MTESTPSCQITTSIPNPLLRRGRTHATRRPVRRSRLDLVLSRLLGPVLDARLSRGSSDAGGRLLDAREAWLTSARHRARLADGWTRVLEDARRPRAALTTRAPVARAAVLEAAPLVTDLVIALHRPAPPAAQDVLAVRALLTDPTGPVYVGGDLRGAVADVLTRALGSS